MRAALDRSLKLIGVVALLASGAVLGTEAAVRWRAAEQTLRIEAPVSNVSHAPTAAVVEAPPAPAAARRRLELTREVDLQSIAAVRQKIATAVGSTGADAVVLPGAVSLPVTGGGTIEIRHVVMHGDRLVYDAATEEFVGSIRVGAVAYGGQPAPLLSDPVTFQVIDAGTNASATIVVKTLAPPFEPIMVKVRNPRPPVTLRVASDSNEPPAEIVLPLEPTLFVQPVSRSIAGEGLGETEIQVQAIADTIAPGQAVLLSAEPAAEFTPSRVVLGPDGTGTAKLKSVHTGKVTITARAAGFEKGTTTVDFTAVTRALSVTRSSSVIQGYGLGVTMLTIVASAPDLPPKQSVTVSVEPAGNLQGKELMLDNGRLDVPMQSEGVGTVRVMVSAPGFASGSTDVTYELPVQTVAAGLGGGLLGGTGRALARPNGRRKWSTLLASLALSVVVAVIAYVLFRIGVNVFPVTPTVTTGAVAVFALAALAGFIGASILPGAQGTGTKGA